MFKKLIVKPNNIILKTTILLAFSLSNINYVAASSLKSYVPEHKVYEHQTTKLLNSKPQSKSTIATIPYVKKDNDVYILLGRTKVNNSNKNKAGKYTNFSGRAKTDEIFLENLLDKLKEESMGLLTPSAEYMLNHSILINKTSIDSQQILYSLLYIDPSMYVTAEQFNEYRHNKKDLLSNKELKKDNFIWLKISELMQLAKNGQLTGKITDIEGKKYEISLSKYFVDNFLLDEELEKVKF